MTMLSGSNNYEYMSVGSVSHGADEEGEQSQMVQPQLGIGGTGKKSTRAEDKDESANDIEIHVRFGEGQDLSLRVPRTDSIMQFKNKVKEARPSIGDKYLRLIHAGKILADNKTLIESLPKSLFTQVEVPHQQHQDLQSRISYSVEAVEAAASNILAGISSRTSHAVSDNSKASSSHRTSTSLGSILPTHTTYSSHGAENSSSSLPRTDSSASHPLSAGDHIAISIPTEPSSSTTLNSKYTQHTSTITIPVQTGPIYFLCSLSDFAPAQPPSDIKKGKAVAQERSVNGNIHRGSSTRSTRTRRLQSITGTSHIPSQGNSGMTVSTSASSSLTLPEMRVHGRSNSHSSAGDNTGALSDVQEEGSVAVADGEIGNVQDGDSSSMLPSQATGFDRLREAGFSEDEIRSIRRQFHASRGTLTSTVGENGIVVGLDQDEDANVRARRIEEEWIDQHGSETLPEGLEGSYSEMVWGLMLGFFMGLVALFWFKEATFSRRQQMGIIAGLMINVGFGVLHLYY
ncbi:hypothetical protein EDD11_004669 [Mortierella claussenii]|nr:hypothetical protein EDD11_004669 [Mortierella claussenii]